MNKRSYLEFLGYGLPPPLDRHPDFPMVGFDRFGNPYLGGPGVEGPLVCQIVPDEANPYLRHFGAGFGRDWDDPESVFLTVRDWCDLGFDVVVHPRRPGVEVAGSGHGISRFLCGGGLSVFIVRELGPLPDGESFRGVTLRGMAVVLGVATPSWGDFSPSYHILPVEYLFDPALPGLPYGLSGPDLKYWLPPPLVFSPGEPTGVEFPSSYAVIDFDLSEQEYRDGGGAVTTSLLRGRSYLSLQGRR